MMPENAGIAVLAHEFAHNLGAIDLYTYGEGQTSAGFWTLMSDSWVGFPLGYLPGGMDPMHLDEWGWLNPLMVSDPTRVYTVTLGQASRFPSGVEPVRAVKILLPDAERLLPVQPHGAWQWWGGDQSLATASMTLKQAIHIPAAGATLEFQTAYDTEAGYDYFYVEVSTNAAVSWQQVASWNGTSPGFPAYVARSFSLAAYANRDMLVRFRYNTDNYIEGAGVFVDDVVVRSTQVLLSDDAETQTTLWNYAGPWARNSGGGSSYTHNYYLQWRNTGVSGGYDQALGDSRFRFGPVNSGLVVWYQDNRYGDNSIANYLKDSPSFGPKGRLLVVDAHPEPYLDPYWVARGVNNERGIVFSRGLMRDAPFSRQSTVNFNLDPPYAYEATNFAGRSAVHWFSDARGYYPGIQNLAPNPWRTVQWDASMVMPSTVPYGVRGQGYAAGAPLEQVIATRSYIGTTELLTYETNTIPGGSSLPGGSGNPGDVNGEFGWNVWIVHQTNTTAEVVIWNSHYSHLDTDNDGMPDWEEAIAGTNPRDYNSALRMTRAQVSDAANGSVQVEWTSASNRIYRLMRTTNLASGFQTVLATNLHATPSTNVFVDLNPPANSPAFYRVEVQ
jgi:immune inhibitor A